MLTETEKFEIAVEILENLKRSLKNDQRYVKDIQNIEILLISFHNALNQERHDLANQARQLGVFGFKFKEKSTIQKWYVLCLQRLKNLKIL